MSKKNGRVDISVPPRCWKHPEAWPHLLVKGLAMKSIPQHSSKKMTGIYAITHTQSKRTYVGSSSNIKRRFVSHRHSLRHNKHPNKHLQNCWNLYGEDAFTFEIIEILDSIDQLELREEYWIQELGASNRVGGFNVRLEAKSNRGYVPSETLKQRWREANQNRPCLPDTRKKLSKAGMNHIVTENTRRKIGQALQGRKRSSDAVAKMKKSMLENPRGRLTYDNVLFLFEQIASGRRVRDVAQEVGIEGGTLRRIIQKKLYQGYIIDEALVKHAQANIGTIARQGFNANKAKLRPDDILEIEKMLRQGYKQKDIAALFKVDSSVISRISTGNHHSSKNSSETSKNTDNAICIQSLLWEQLDQ